MYVITIGILIVGFTLCNSFKKEVTIALGSKFVQGFQLRYYDETRSNGIHAQTTKIIIPNTTIAGKIISNFETSVVVLFFATMLICIVIIYTIPTNENSQTSFPKWLT
jgi:hypothetical protein